jgi:hypothetical protein
MQPTRNQVEQSLAALGTRTPLLTGSVPGFLRVADDHARELVVDAIGSLPAGLLDQLERTIDVRFERLDQARARLEHGSALSADELADRIVGRLVCDRLR